MVNSTLKFGRTVHVTYSQPSPDGQVALGSEHHQPLSSVRHERVEHLPHRLHVAAHDRCRCLDVPDGVKVLPAEVESRVAGELLEEGALGPPVALAERMDRVDLAQVEGQPVNERASFQAT
jgi:hypothetical protein